MEYKAQYEKARDDILNDKEICKENRELFKKFFEYLEYKLKRINDLRKLDDNSYKTCYAYVTRFRTVNRWFANKPWKNLTKEDLKKVYDDLEDGNIKKLNGEPLKDKKSFYKMILRSKPFEMAGKKNLMIEVMEFMPKKQEDDVRFITEETFRKIIEVTRSPLHRLFLWLCWDIGENGISIIRLKKKDFIRQQNEHSKEPEYRVVLRKEILKRSRTPRTEITNYKETAQLLDIFLKDMKDEDNLFNFGHRQAEKIVDFGAKTINAVCIPNGQKVTLKDLRSSMACDLLSKGWNTDEINSRLGHKLSSRMLDRYVNHLAINRHAPKKKVYESKISELMAKVEEFESREKLDQQRMKNLNEELQEYKKENDNTKMLLKEIYTMVKGTKEKSR